MDSTINQPTHLSPSVSYYIRKLLRQNFDQLKLIAAISARIKADPFMDLNVVLTNLYKNEPEIRSIVLHLERLVTTHQALGRQRASYLCEMADLEQEIFGLLGLFRSSLITTVA